MQGERDDWVRRLDDAYEARRRGDRARAEAVVDDLLTRTPDLGRAWMLKGVLIDVAAFPRQLAALEQAAAVAPGDAEIWYNLGVCLGQAGRWREARAATRRALTIDPLNPDSLANACELERVLGLHRSALDLADRRLALGPAPWPVHLARGLCLLHLTRAAEAEGALREAMASAPPGAPIADLIRRGAAGRPAAETDALIARLTAAA